MKVVKLDRHPLAQEKRRACIDELQEAIRRVRAGDVEAVGIVMVTRNGEAIYQRTAVNKGSAMIGGLARLQHDILTASVEVVKAEI